jgi:hypothetical protein
MNIKLQCVSCDKDFNNTDRLPKMLPTCGHTICQKCLYTYGNSSKNFICFIDGMVLKIFFHFFTIIFYIVKGFKEEFPLLLFSYRLTLSIFIKSSNKK